MRNCLSLPPRPHRANGDHAFYRKQKNACGDMAEINNKLPNNQTNKQTYLSLKSARGNGPGVNGRNEKDGDPANGRKQGRSGAFIRGRGGCAPSIVSGKPTMLSHLASFPESRPRMIEPPPSFPETRPACSQKTPLRHQNLSTTQLSARLDHLSGGDGFWKRSGFL